MKKIYILLHKYMHVFSWYVWGGGLTEKVVSSAYYMASHPRRKIVMLPSLDTIIVQGRP